MEKDDFETHPILIRRYAKKLLPRLTALLSLRKGVPVAEVDAVSIAVQETTERLEQEEKIE